MLTETVLSKLKHLWKVYKLSSEQITYQLKMNKF